MLSFNPIRRKLGTQFAYGRTEEIATRTRLTRQTNPKWKQNEHGK